MGLPSELAGGHLVSVCYCSDSSVARGPRYASAYQQFSALHSSSDRFLSQLPGLLKFGGGGRPFQAETGARSGFLIQTGGLFQRGGPVPEVSVDGNVVPRR